MPSDIGRLGGAPWKWRASGPADLPVAASLMPALTPAAVQMSGLDPAGTQSRTICWGRNLVSPLSSPGGITFFIKKATACALMPRTRVSVCESSRDLASYYHAPIDESLVTGGADEQRGGAVGVIASAPLLWRVSMARPSGSVYTSAFPWINSLHFSGPSRQNAPSHVQEVTDESHGCLEDCSREIQNCS
jgi:hypothetical protein